MIVLIPFIILVWVAESSFRKQWNFFFFALRQRQGKTAEVMRISGFGRECVELQLQKESEKSLRQIIIFSKHLLFLSTCSSN